jgi:hypothetical protein
MAAEAPATGLPIHVFSRSDHVAGLVTSRQRFVRRCHLNWTAASRLLVAPTPSWDLFVHGSINGRSNAARKSGKEDYDKFSLPTGSGFIENILKIGARSLTSDAEFDLGGPKCFSCNEMKC